jgi:hypothetical protein
MGLTLASSVLLTACQREDAAPDCSQGSFYVLNDSGLAVTLSLTPTSGMGAALSFEVDSTQTIEEPLSAPAGEYRVQAIETGTSTVLFDSDLSGETLTVDGCEGPSFVAVPMPAPTPECEPMGRHGAWTRISFSSAADVSPEVCTDFTLRAEARDDCGNLLTEVNEPALWQLALESPSVRLVPTSVETVDRSPRFVNGVATATVHSNEAQSVQLTVTGGGIISPVRNLAFGSIPRLLQTLLVPANFDISTGTALVVCTAEDLDGTAQNLFLRVILYDACTEPTLASNDLTVTIGSGRGLFAPVTLTLPMGTPWVTSDPLLFLSGSAPRNVTDTLTTTLSDDQIMSWPLNVRYDPTCRGRAF